MAVQVLVNAVDVTTLYQRKSLSIKQSGGGGIVTAECQFVDLAGTAAISPEHVMRILNNGTEVFEGKIKKRNRKGTPDPGPNPKKVYKVSAQDYTHLLTQDVIDQTLVRSGSRTDKAEVEYLLTTFGTKGVAIGTLVQSTGTITRDIDYTGMNLYEALEEAGKWLGTGFFVDNDLFCHWFVTEANAAPFNFSDAPNNTTTFGYTDLDMGDDSLDLVNAVWVVGTGIQQWETNASSIATYGRIETTLRDPDITTAGQATAAGQGFLNDHAFPETPITLTTFKDGLKAGNTIQITNALWGLAAVTYRVTDVTARHNSETDSLVYDVSLASRPVNLADLFSNTGRQIAVTGAMAGSQESAIASIAVDMSAGGGNLIPNSSFESGSSGSWTVGSVWTFGYVPSGGQLAFHGTDVARLVPVGATTGELAVTNFIPITRGDWYNFSWFSFLRARTAGNYKVVFREYDAAGALLATTTDTLAAVETAWTRHILRFGPNTQIPGVIQWNASTAKIKVAFFADTSPTGTWDVDGIQFERGKIVTAYAPMPQELIDSQITTTQIADDAVTTPKLVSGSVVTGKLAAGAVTANELAALAVTAAKIAAGAVTADKMTVGSRTAQASMVPNHSFEDNAGSGGAITGWTPGGGGTWAAYAEASATAGAVTDGGFCATLQANSGGASYAQLVSSRFGVSPGETLYCSVHLYPTMTSTGSVYFRLNFFKYDGSASATPQLDIVSGGNSTAGVEQTIKGYITVPSDATFCSITLFNWHPVVTGYYLYDNVIIQRAAGGVINNTGDVTIDSSGIVVRNGSLVFQDDFGSTSLTGRGFTSAWLRFLMNRMYNSDFGVGSLSDIPDSETGSGAPTANYDASISPNLPYWVVGNDGVATNTTVRVVADSLAPSGRALRFSVPLSGGVGGKRAYQDVPIDGLLMPTVKFMAKTSLPGNLQYTGQMWLSYRDVNHDLIGSRVNGGIQTLYGGAYTQIANYGMNGIGVPPMNARYLRVEFDFVGGSAGAGTALVYIALVDVGAGRVYADILNTFAQSIAANSTWTALTGTGGSGAARDALWQVANASRLLTPWPGLYRVLAIADWTGDASTRRILGLGYDGATPIASNERTMPNGGGVTFALHQEGSWVVERAVGGGYLQVMASQNKAATLNVVDSELFIEYLGS